MRFRVPFWIVCGWVLGSPNLAKIVLRRLSAALVALSRCLGHFRAPSGASLDLLVVVFGPVGVSGGVLGVHFGCFGDAFGMHWALWKDPLGSLGPHKLFIISNCDAFRTDFRKVANFCNCVGPFWSWGRIV